MCVCKCTEPCLWSGGDIFCLGSAGPPGWAAGIKLQCVDHGVCVAACIQWREALPDGQEVFQEAGVFIGLSPQLKQANTGISLR